MRTMSCWGMPSVMQTTSGISASIASSIPLAATGGLYKGQYELCKAIRHGLPTARILRRLSRQSAS